MRDHDEPAGEPPSPSRSRRGLSVRWNALMVTQARGSVDVEWFALPRLSLLASPHVTFPQNRDVLVARALGFAGARASGVGLELGARYYTSAAGEPDGMFVGASLLVDSTRPVPGANRFTAYGGAVDLGYGIVFSPGLTLSAGGGLLVITADGIATELAPRALFGIGWSF